MRPREEHPQFFIKDGNVVLCVPATQREVDILFCVHQSTLMKQSSIFNDMLTLSKPSPGGNETYNDIELIKLSDSAEAWAGLLAILYEPM